MPHLVFCGRYWRVAGDELSLPTLCAVVGRALWTTILLVILSYTAKSSACHYGLTAYLSISVGLFVSSILCEVSLIRVSLQGSIVETHRRSGLDKILLLHIVLGSLEFCCAVFGIAVITKRARVPCTADALDTSSTDVILLSVVVASQLIDITALLCCCYLFAANKVDRDDAAAPRDERWAHSTWEKRCRMVCQGLQICTCNIFGGGNVAEDLEKVAKILTAFFHHDGFLDVVPSDVVAGILLVRVQQREGYGGGMEGAARGGSEYARLEDGETSSLESVSGVELLALSPERRRQYINQSPRRALSPRTNPADAALLKELAHYSVYAMSIYTHLMLLFVHPCSGVCQLCQSLYCRRGLCRRINSHLQPQLSQSSSTQAYTTSVKSMQISSHRQRNVRGDGCCGLNEAAVAQFTRKYHSKLVFAAFENSVHVKPYAIFLDHERRKTVITIRGTITLEDWITDGISDSVELVEAGRLWGFQGEGRFGHEGFVSAALRIRQELDTNNMLKNLFNSAISPLPPNIHTPLNVKTSANANTDTDLLYPLVVVGHSLGAGVAVLLSLFLRHAHPDVQCYAFGCPGSVVDNATAREVEGYVTSVVLGRDMVPSLSFTALGSLREQVLYSIARARVNKAHIMQSIFRECPSSDYLHAPGEEPPSRFKSMVQAFTAQVSGRQQALIPLFLPGRVIHLAKTPGPRSWLPCRPRRYEAAEVSWEAFSELRVSPTMVVDHFVDRYVAELARICDEL